MKNNQKDFTRLLVLGVSLSIIAFAGYFVLSQNSTKVNTSTTSQIDTSGWETYTNTEFGFQLMLPPDWNGYSVERHEAQLSDYPNPSSRDTISEYNEQKGTVQFSFKLKDGNQSYSAFIITAHLKTYWSKIYQDNGVLGGTKIGEKNGFVFSKSTPQEPPASLNYEKISSDTKQILSTFKFTTPTYIPTPKPLVKIYSHGGLCVTGSECQSTTTLESDGKVINSGKTVKTLSATDIANLTKDINSENFKAIESTKFTGMCPIAYDGQEIVYTFYTSSGMHTLDSCEVVIDMNSKLFKEVWKMISGQ